VIVVHTRHRGLEQIIAGHLSGLVHRTATSPSEFRLLVTTETPEIVIVGALECTATLVRLLKTTLQLDRRRGPSCIVVTRVTFDNLRKLRDIEGDRLHVGWIEEIEEGLPKLLDRVKGRGKRLLPALKPLRIEEIREDQTLMSGNVEPGQTLRALGLWLLNERPLTPAFARAVDAVCRVEDDDNGPVPPATSVAELAKRVDLHPAKLGYLWKTRIPLRCTMRQMIQWSVLLWAVRNREHGSTWRDMAHTADLSLQTLQRYSQKLARCSLTDLGENSPPGWVETVFTEWLSGVATE